MDSKSMAMEDSSGSTEKDSSWPNGVQKCEGWTACKSAKLIHVQSKGFILPPPPTTQVRGRKKGKNKFKVWICWVG